MLASAVMQQPAARAALLTDRYPFNIAYIYIYTRRFKAFNRAPQPFFTYQPDENLALGASGVFPFHSLLPPDSDHSEYRLWYDCWRDVWGVCYATSLDGEVWTRHVKAQRP